MPSPMKRPVAAIALGCAASLGALQAPPASAFTLDPSNTVIVAEHNPEAVRELKTHLDYLTGADIRVVPAKDEKTVPAGAYVWRVCAPTKEEFAVERASWEVTPTNAVFHGPRRYAVCDYLEGAMGVRWPYGTNIVWYGKRPADFATGRGEWRSALRIRNMRGKGDGLDWRFRHRDGAHDRPVYGHAFTKYWGRFSKTHPEYFAMRADGKRLPIKCDEDVRDRDQHTAKPGTKEAKYIDHISMCPSCEGLADQLVADWQAAGAGPYLNACENDSPGGDACHCKACKALDEPPPPDAKNWWPNWYADRYVVLAKRVLEKARRIRPDVKVTMYAYNATEAAPRREKLDPAIIVGLVPTYFGKEEFTRYLEAWKQAGMNEFFCRSNRRCYFNPAYTPVGWERHFFDLCIYAQRRGAIGFDYDGGTPKKHCAAAWLADYVVHKAMVDPSKPFEYWIDHYCSAYGSAAADVKEYYRYWREDVFEKRIAPDFMKISVYGKVFNFTRGLFWKLGDYYRPEDYQYALSVLDKALARPELEPEARRLLGELRFTTEHASLIYEAVVHKGTSKKPYSQKLYEYRKAHGLQIKPHYEDYWGDLTGMRAYDDKTAKK